MRLATSHPPCRQPNPPMAFPAHFQTWTVCIMETNSATPLSRRPSPTSPPLLPPPTPRNWKLGISLTNSANPRLRRPSPTSPPLLPPATPRNWKLGTLLTNSPSPCVTLPRPLPPCLKGPGKMEKQQLIDQRPSAALPDAAEHPATVLTARPDLFARQVQLATLLRPWLPRRSQLFPTNVPRTAITQPLDSVFSRSVAVPVMGSWRNNARCHD